MSEQARRLGIPLEHIALIAARLRDIREEAVKLGIDPRAFRVALLVALKIDTYWARRLKFEWELSLLNWIAEELFKKVLREWGAPSR